ncbi:MAG: T9SS type A sorting domain-containing protein, partial [Chitinophagaceae bacterium]|nr:T9SS type A sorting domain-containing protein [Chitinophagaceae bacterium]
LAVRGTGIYNDGYLSDNNLLKVSTVGLPIPTEFLNCDYGIKNHNSNLDVHKANFQTTTFTCIRHQASTNLRNNLMVDSCTLNQFSEYGIFSLWTLSGASPIMKIRDNNITMNDIVNPNKKAIYVSGPSLVGSLVLPLTGSNATIFGNNITIPTNTNNKTGIEMRWMKNGRIVRNTITLNTGALTTGISLIGLVNNTTNCNTIVGVVTVTVSTIGISMNQVGYSMIRCNNLSRLQKCIYITSASGPSTLLANSMYNSRQGIELTSTAAIGPQFLNGNAWYGTSWLPVTGKILCPPSLGLIFTCTNTIPWNPIGFASPTCFTTSALASQNCNSELCSEMSFKTTEEPAAEVEENLPNIANSLVTIFPNPASNLLNIRNTHWEQATEYTVYNLQGAKVLKLMNPNSETQTLDISTLSKGMYILQIRSNDQIENLKFSKQ